MPETTADAVSLDVLQAVANQIDTMSRRFSNSAHRWLTATSRTAQFAAEVRADAWATALTTVVLPTLGAGFAMGLDPMRIAQDVHNAAGLKNFDPNLIHERIMEVVREDLAAW
jgi:hypothetical protein